MPVMVLNLSSSGSESLLQVPCTPIPGAKIVPCVLIFRRAVHTAQHDARAVMLWHHTEVMQNL